MTKRKIKKRIIEIRDEIQAEIRRQQDAGCYKNIGKEGCVKRLNKLIEEFR